MLAARTARNTHQETLTTSHTAAHAIDSRDASRVASIRGKSQKSITCRCTTLQKLVGWLGSFDAQGHLVRYADAVAFQSDHFFRVIRQDSNVVEPEVDQNLRPDPAFVLHHALACRLAVELSAPMEMNLRQRARRFAGFDAEAASGVVQIKEDATAFLGDCRERARH